jgi:hypothetical protein
LVLWWCRPTKASCRSNIEGWRQTAAWCCRHGVMMCDLLMMCLSATLLTCMPSLGMYSCLKIVRENFKTGIITRQSLNSSCSESSKVSQAYSFWITSQFR